MSEWISVEDRLPDKPCNYLIHVPPVYTYVVFYNGYDWVVDEDEFCFNAYEITHWMPLPEPPKESKKRIKDHVCNNDYCELE